MVATHVWSTACAWVRAGSDTIASQNYRCRESGVRSARAPSGFDTQVFAPHGWQGRTGLGSAWVGTVARCDLRLASNPVVFRMTCPSLGERTFRGQRKSIGRQPGVEIRPAGVLY